MRTTGIAQGLEERWDLFFFFFCEWVRERERARKLNKMSVVVQQWLCRLHATLTSTIHAPILCLHLSDSWPSLLCISCNTRSSNALNYRVSFTTGGILQNLFVPVSALQELRTAKQQMRVCHERHVNAASVGKKIKRNLLILIKKWSIAREKWQWNIYGIYRNWARMPKFCILIAFNLLLGSHYTLKQCRLKKRRLERCRRKCKSCHCHFLLPVWMQTKKRIEK